VSRENVEIVRTLYDSFDRGDHEFPFRTYDAEIVWENFAPPPAGMEATYHGHDGVRRFWRQWFDAWGRVEFAYEQLFDAGDDVVVFLGMRAFGRASGIETAVDEYAQVWTLHDGMVVRMRFYADRDEALAAAGITPEGA